MIKHLLATKIDFKTRTLFTKVVFFFVLINCLGILGAKAQTPKVSENYLFNQSTGNVYTPITGGTVIAASGAIFPTAGFVSGAIPFNFRYNNVDYTSLYVSINGFISLGTAPTIGNFTPISGAEGAGIISGFGQRLAHNTPALVTSSTAEVSYLITGSAPNRIFTAQYKDCFRKNAFSTYYNQLINMQIVLNEATGEITINYGTPAIGTGGTAASATTFLGQVGLRGANNTDFLSRKYTTATSVWSLATNALALVLADNMPLTAAIAFDAGLRYTYTPCYRAINIVRTLQADNSTLDVSWTSALSPATSYVWEIRTDTNPGVVSGALVFTGTATSPVNSFQVTGLNLGITYYIYVRPICNATGWNNGTSVTPACPAITSLPYTQDFSTSVLPSVPTCNFTQIASLTESFITRDSSIASNQFGFTNKNLITSGQNAANAWYYTQKVTLAPGEYSLTYKYGSTRESAFYEQKMKVGFALSNTAAAMLVTSATSGILADHSSIKTSPINGELTFTVTIAGDYYIGFNGYAGASQGFLQIDDIVLDNATCKKPTALATDQLSATSTNVVYTAPVLAPSNGYQYILSTTATPPISTSTPTGNVATGTTLLSLNGLTPSTTYYLWIRSNCGSSTSSWAFISFTTLAQATYCANPVASNPNVFFTNVTTTSGVANINNTTVASPTGYSNYTGLFVSQSVGSTVNFSTTTSGATAGVAIWVDWNDDGTFAAGEKMFNTTALVFSPSGSFIIPAATIGEHRMRMMVDRHIINPTNPCAFTLNVDTRGEIEDYTIRVIVSPPALTLNTNSTTQCANTNSTLVTITSSISPSTYSSFTWSPSIGVTGSAGGGYTFNSPSTITYTLTAVQNFAPYSTKTVNYTYIANVLPSPIVLTPASGTSVCPNTPVAITATGGIVPTIAIAPVSENFNSGSGGWTAQNFSDPTNFSLPAFTIRPSPYTTPPPTSGPFTFSSNDNSNFYFVNADAQGAGNFTNVVLTSPVFSLSGYTAASLSFYHYYRPWINGSAKVEIFSAGSWTQLNLWGNTSNTSTQGSPTNFVNVIDNLNAYAGLSGLQLRFTYEATFGWYWALDNVSVTATSTSNITWSPIAGLYLDPTATTTPITALTTSNVVYAKINTPTTYTATSTTPANCSVSTPITLNITNINSSSITPLTQTICSVAAPLTLASYSGAIVKWQSANDLLFTVNVQDIASTSSTLSSTLMGTFTANKYFRAAVLIGSCTVYSNVASVFLTSTTWTTSWSNGTPDSSKKVIFAGSYISTGDMYACSVQVLPGAVVTFNTNHTLRVVNELVVSNQLLPTPSGLTFENGASLVQDNDILNTGAILYKRNSTGMYAFDYTYWGSPVTNQTFQQFSPNTSTDKFFRWNTPTNQWINMAPTSTMDLARGYIIRAPNGAPYNSATPTIFNGQFFGVPNNGQVTRTLQSGFNKANLIGNPYPCAINADDFISLADNGFAITGALYFWTHNTPISGNVYTNSDFASYNLSGGIGVASVNSGVSTQAPTNELAAGQGFFVQGLDTSYDVTFDNTIRLSNSNLNFFKNSPSHLSNIERNRMWLNLYNTEGAFKQIMVGYIQNATNALDNKYDAKLIDVNNAATMYSLIGLDKLVIQAKGLPFDFNDTIDLGYRSNIVSNYKIKLQDFDGLFSNQDIFIEDKLLNVIHNLKESDYSFNTEIGTFDDRFTLRFTNPNLLLNQSNVFNNDSVQVVKKNNEIQFLSSLSDMQSIVIHDIQGRILYTNKNVNSKEFKISNLISEQQVLMITITSIEGKVVNKKIIF